MQTHATRWHHQSTDVLSHFQNSLSNWCATSNWCTDKNAQTKMKSRFCVLKNIHLNFCEKWMGSNQRKHSIQLSFRAKFKRIETHDIKSQIYAYLHNAVSWTRYQSQCTSAHVPTLNKSIDVFQPNDETRRYDTVYWIDERRNTIEPVSNQEDREGMMIHQWNGKIHIREEYREKKHDFLWIDYYESAVFYWTDSTFRMILL